MATLFTVYNCGKNVGSYRYLQAYCGKHKLKINSKKTKAMLFNSKTNIDFMPRLFLQDGSSVEVVEEFKLLGIILTSDLK